MAAETMTSEERFWAAVRLEKPDRVPVAPLVDTAAACKLLGLNSWDVVEAGIDAQLDVILRLFDTFGGWDGLNPPAPPQLFALGGTRVKFPTADSPENQIIEAELWTPDEYDLLIEIGYNRFMAECVIPAHRPSSGRQQAIQKLVGDMQRAAGAVFSMSALQTGGRALGIRKAAIHPFFWLSLTRSMIRFTEDIFRRPDVVEKALDKIVPEWIENAIAFCKVTGAKTFYFSEERAGAFFLPPGGIRAALVAPHPVESWTP